ncbi:MAG: 30S ribosome-binding factor RbfA [Anaerolineae bacterium]|nr:30S ribosome-binding factor RbfA [Anaerolineae bacterium]
MPTKRQRRVAEQIHQVLAELIQFEAEDPRLDGVTIMDVLIDREFMVATVYVNSLQGEKAQREVMAGLDRAAGFLRYELGKRVQLQNTPELRFKWDESLETAARIDALIASLRETQNGEEAENADAPN